MCLIKQRIIKINFKKMKRIIVIIAFLTLNVTFSQKVEKKEINKKVQDFKIAYNNSDYVAIFNLFNDKMKIEFPLERVEKFYGKIKKGKGLIKTLSYERIEGGVYIYTAKFKRDELNLEIGIDESCDVNKLYIKREKRDYKRN